MEKLKQQFIEILKRVSIQQLISQTKILGLPTCNRLKKNIIFKMIMQQGNQQAIRRRYEYYKGTNRLPSQSYSKQQIITQIYKKNLLLNFQNQMFKKITNKQNMHIQSLKYFEKIYQKDQQQKCFVNSIEIPQILQIDAQYQLKKEQIRYSLRVKSLYQLKTTLKNLLQEHSERFDTKCLVKQASSLQRDQIRKLIHILFSINKQLDFEKTDNIQQIIYKIQKAVISQDKLQLTQIKLNFKSYRTVNIKKRYKYYQQILELVQFKTLTILIEKIKENLQTQKIQILARSLFLVQLIISSKQIFKDAAQRNTQVNLLKQIFISSTNVLKLYSNHKESNKMFNQLRVIYILKLIQEAIFIYQKKKIEDLQKFKLVFIQKMNQRIQIFAGDMQISNLKQLNHMIYYLFDENQFNNQTKKILKQISLVAKHIQS